MVVRSLAFRTLVRVGRPPLPVSVYALAYLHTYITTELLVTATKKAILITIKPRATAAEP